jgi:hypothetical protein
MSRHTYALAGALAIGLTIAGAPQATRAEPPSATPQASHPIILAERECIAWKRVNGHNVCVRWYDCKPGSKVC